MPPGIDQIEKGSILFDARPAATAAAIFALIAIWLLVLFIRSKDRLSQEQKEHAKVLELLNERHDKEITRLYDDRIHAAMEQSAMLARGEEALKATAAFLAKLTPPPPATVPAPPTRRSGSKRSLIATAPSGQTEVIQTGNTGKGGAGDE